MNPFRNLLYGRNGVDQLAIAVIVAAGVFLIASAVTGAVVFSFAYLACVLYFLFRIMSRNIHARRSENIRFLSFANKLRSPVKLRVRMLRERKTHKYLRCPKCRAMLRVPKGRGKVNVRCSKCGIEFIKQV